MSAHQRAVDVSAEIFFFTEIACAVARHRHECHERPVTHKQDERDAGDYAYLGTDARLLVRAYFLPHRCQIKQSGGEIAHRYTLQDAHDADCVEIEERKAIQEKPDGKDERAAAEHMDGHRAARYPARHARCE